MWDNRRMTSGIFDSDAFNDRLFFPRDDTSAPPNGARDLMVTVAGAQLHVRIHAADGARCTVLLFHGNGEVVADYDDAAARFADCGAALAIADFRGYGASTGEPNLRNTVEDAQLVVAAMPIDSARPLVIMGRSLGSVSMAELYRAPTPRIAGFIWESGIGDLYGLVARRGLERPARLDEADLRTFDPLPKLAAGSAPLLVLHGVEDDVIDVSEAKTVYASAGTTRKELVLIPGRGHNDLMREPIYWDAIARFVAAL